MLPALPVLLLPVMDEAEELLLFPMGGRTDDDYFQHELRTAYDLLPAA